jgi:hypothetical protein
MENTTFDLEQENHFLLVQIQFILFESGSSTLSEMLEVHRVCFKGYKYWFLI